jgi:ankyrin repeat protein
MDLSQIKDIWLYIAIPVTIIVSIGTYKFYKRSKIPSLIKACKQRNIDLALNLIKKGNLDVADDNRRTALIWACINKMTLVILELIKNGANLDLRDKFGKTALMELCSKSNYNIMTFELIERGANLNIQDDDGKTALMYSVDINSQIVGLKLLKEGADFMIADDNGDTALSLASLRNMDLIVLEIFQRMELI